MLLNDSKDNVFDRDSFRVQPISEAKDKEKVDRMKTKYQITFNPLAFQWPCLSKK